MICERTDGHLRRITARCFDCWLNSLREHGFRSSLIVLMVRARRTIVALDSSAGSISRIKREPKLKVATMLNHVQTFQFLEVSSVSRDLQTMMKRCRATLTYCVARDTDAHGVLETVKQRKAHAHSPSPAIMPRN